MGEATVGMQHSAERFRNTTWICKDNRVKINSPALGTKISNIGLVVEDFSGVTSGILCLYYSVARLLGWPAKSPSQRSPEESLQNLPGARSGFHRACFLLYARRVGHSFSHKLYIMSRIKVHEEKLGPIVPGGPEFVLETWHEFLFEGDVEPLSTEHEIPFNLFTRPIK